MPSWAYVITKVVSPTPKQNKTKQKKKKKKKNSLKEKRLPTLKLKEKKTLGSWR